MRKLNQPHWLHAYRSVCGCVCDGIYIVLSDSITDIYSNRYISGSSSACAAAPSHGRTEAPAASITDRADRGVSVKKGPGLNGVKPVPYSRLVILWGQTANTNKMILPCVHAFRSYIDTPDYQVANMLQKCIVFDDGRNHPASLSHATRPPGLHGCTAPGLPSIVFSFHTHVHPQTEAASLKPLKLNSGTLVCHLTSALHGASHA